MVRALLTLLILSLSPLSAKIVEIEHFDQLFCHIKPHTLIVLDLDNTLIEPVQQLGSDQWFYSQIARYEEEGMPKEDALERALADWMAVQNITKVKTPEPGIASTVERLQERGFAVIGLTTRGLGLSKTSLEQLKSVGIDLSITAPSKEEQYFRLNRGVLYRGGVLFTANTHKGEALFKLLDQISYRPRSILFINDKKSHLIPIEETSAARAVPFVGLRYGFLDQKVKNLNTALTDIQWKKFGHLISDEEAMKALKECQPAMN